MRLGETVTARATPDRLHRLPQRDRQTLRAWPVALKQVKRHALCGLWPNARQAPQRFDQFLKRRPAWQWLVFGSALAQGLFRRRHAVYVERRRYGQPVILQRIRRDVLPAAADQVARPRTLAPWVVGGLFCAPMVLNPFAASCSNPPTSRDRPAAPAPVELTLLNDLPVNTDRSAAACGSAIRGRGSGSSRSRSSTTTRAAARIGPGLLGREGSRAPEFVIKTDRPIRAIVTVAAGPVAADVTMCIAGHSQSLHLVAGETQQVTMAMPPGLPCEKEVHAVAWLASVTSSSGFTPIFYDPKVTDARLSRRPRQADARKHARDDDAGRE